MEYSLKEITAIVSGELKIHDSSRVVRRISTDSRTISSAQNTLFVAIKTQRNDGHGYILDAYRKGVRNFLVEKNIELKDANFIQVKNSVKALQQLAAKHRSKSELTTIGITGSNGKTIVKEWLNQLLATEYSIIRSPKSYNSQIGVPLSVLNLEETHDLAIFEAGISQAGEMQNLEPIIRPTLGILTNIGRSHLENFSSVKELVAEKMKLFVHCKKLIVSGKFLPLIKTPFQGEIIAWGECLGNGLCLEEKLQNSTKTTITARWKAEKITLEIPFTDKASIDNALTCVTTLLHLGYTIETINQRLKTLSSVAMRLNIVEGKNGCTIINDSYSLDVFSLEIALDFLKKHEVNAEKIVILSDVEEVRSSEKEIYHEIDSLLSSHQISKLITIGKKVGAFTDTFAIPVNNYASVDDFLAETETIHSFKNKDILIKGARKFSFENIVKFLQAKSHSTVLEINLNAVVNNLNYFKSLLQPEVKIMVMVKALSYGSGTHEIAQLLAFNRVDYLGVAYSDEGISLRQAGISLPIMVMNPDFNQLIEHHLEPEIFSFHKLDEFNELLEYHKEIESYPVHLKIDTGMHRLGFEENDISELIKRLRKYNKIKVVSVFTHLAATDVSSEDAFTQSQLSLYKNIVEQLENALGYSFVKHALNTAGILRFPHKQMDMVRLGIGLYGISSLEKFQAHLENVGTLKTYVSQVKTIKMGESVGYNRAFIAQRDCEIATIPIGYADGFSRAFSQGNGEVLCQGKLVPVIGNVCMDMTMIDVSGMEVHAGDEVIIFGENLSVHSLAQKTNTISYEILSGISERVKRVFVEE